MNWLLSILLVIVVYVTDAWVIIAALGIVSLKVYDITIWRYRKSHTKVEVIKMHICSVWIQILCEISKVPFEISHKTLNPHTAKYVFYEVIKFDELCYRKVMTS